MSKRKTFNIKCPSCGTQQDVELYEAVNVAVEPELKQALLENRETETLAREQIIEDFDQSLEQINEMLPADITAPNVRLVLTRVGLVELIFMLEAELNERVVEYVKYSIHTRNMEKVDPNRFRLLLNVQDSTDEELCFVIQDIESQELGRELRYGRAAYQSMCGLYNETPEEFIEMFPGPYISARNLLLDDSVEA